MALGLVVSGVFSNLIDYVIKCTASKASPAQLVRAQYEPQEAAGVIEEYPFSWFG